MFQLNYNSLGGSAGDFEGTSSFYTVSEAVIPECYMGTAGGKQWAQSCRSGLLRRKGINDGEILAQTMWMPAYLECVQALQLIPTPAHSREH